MEKFYTYILYSISLDSYYVGSTNNIERRFSDHNKGLSNYTKKGKPWKMVHLEEFDTKSKAYQRELQIKSWKSKLKTKELVGETD